MDERVTAIGVVRAVSPPWLRRTHGARLLESIAEQLDALAQRGIDAAKLRFPGAPPGPVDPSALALIGRDRRIPRGPLEDPEPYAARVLAWWDAHRGRGGGFALLSQLHRFWFDALRCRIDLVSVLGVRHSVDANGAITLDAIGWQADGSGQGWAGFWVFFFMPAVVGDVLTTEAGETLLTESGESLIATLPLSSLISAPGVVSSTDEANFTAVPREWAPAHTRRAYVVLLWDTSRLWGYPQPVPTWGTWGTWQSTNPVYLTAIAPGS